MAKKKPADKAEKAGKGYEKMAEKEMPPFLKGKKTAAKGGGMKRASKKGCS